MRTISFTAFKGGSGKTTALMAMASSLVERGQRVALIEGDDNEPLRVWRQYGLDLGTWDDRCQVYPATDLDRLDSAYERAEADRMDVALIDTRGGGSDLNQAIMMNSNLIVIPTGLSVMEIDEALSSLEYAANFMKSVQIEVPIGFLINRTPTNTLASGDREGLAVLGELPVFDCRLPERRIYKDFKGIGLLYPYHRMLMDMPGKRISATHTKVALMEVDLLTEELLGAMTLEEAA